MADRTEKLSLAGSVSLGTGVMIGAGIFALVGQVAGLAGDAFPFAFALGALVAGVSSYSYVRYSAVNPSSGGIAMLLRAAYGPGVVAGTFSLFMYVSMVVAESLLARTFGTYLLRPWGLQDHAVLVPLLGVVAIVVAVVVNLVGTRVVEGSATASAVLKIGGLAVLAVAGLVAAATAGPGTLPSGSGGSSSGTDAVGLLAGATLCVLAFKGFTTITNQGDDLRDPERNIPRSIVLSLLVCTVLYLLVTIAVRVSIGAEGAVEARDDALAEAGEPLFGSWGVAITVVVAVVATLSGLLASLYSVSRLYAMLQEMRQAPSLPGGVPHQPMLITAGLALLATVALDLTQIASTGAFLYLSMDLAVQWGVLRRLRGDIGARPWPPVLAIVLDLLVLVPFTLRQVRDDPRTVVVAAVVAVVVLLAQVVAVHRRR